MCVCVQLGYIVSMHAGSELRTNHLEFVVQVGADDGTMSFCQAVQHMSCQTVRYMPGSTIPILSGSTIPVLSGCTLPGSKCPLILSTLHPSSLPIPHTVHTVHTVLCSPPPIERRSLG